MLSILSLVFAFDAIIDLGSGTFQVGTLRRVGSGNPIEAILNSQSKRFSPTVVAFDGEQFHVGEYGQAYFRKNPGPVFRHFTNEPTEPLVKFANDPEAPELEDVQGYQAVLLITALMNHIVSNMIKRNDTTVDVTLIHPVKWTLGHLAAFKHAVEQLPNTTLFMSVPTPAAVVITHLASRMKDFDKNVGQQFVVIDVGATATEASVVRASYNEESQDVEVTVQFNEDFPRGGDDITRCLADRHVIPEMKEIDPKNFKLLKRVEDAVEKAKIALSATAFTKLTVESGKSAHEDFQTVLTKEQVDSCVESLFSDAELAVFQNVGFYLDPALGEENTFYLFYGGSSRVPKLQQIFENVFGAPILKTVNMDEGAIYGGGLVAARHIVGFKVANRFNAFDATRPFLYYKPDGQGSTAEETKLYQLNPNVKYAFQTQFPSYEDDTFQLSNGSFSVNHINESFYWETDETGERKKKSSQMYNTANVEYTKIIVNPDPFKTLDFVAYVDEESKNETFFTYSCNLTIAKFDHQKLLKKYEAKKKPGEQSTGMQGVKVSKMPEIRRDAEKYSETVKNFHDLLLKHLGDEATRQRYDLNLVLNFTSDSTAMPNLTYAAMTVFDKEKQSADESFLKEFVFEPKCEFVHNPRFMVDEYMFREAFNVVWDSNDIQEKRKQYEDSFNMVETILMNADEFLNKYPGANETSGNHLVYADEADFLRVAVDDARYFMQHSHYLPHCPCVECIEERISDLSAVLKRVVDLQESIAKHVEMAQCRPESEKRFKAAMDQMNTALKAAEELQQSEKGQTYNEIMAVCNIIKAVEVDKDEDKEDKDKDKKKKGAFAKDDEKEEEKQESEVDRLKRVKKHQGKLKGAKATLERYYFEDFFAIYGHVKGISESETSGLENFYTRAMMKKLRKTSNDCGFLNGTYSSMLNKVQNHTNLKNGTRKDYLEFERTFSAEMSLRPETPCEKIKNKTKDIEKEAQELEKKVKDVRGELDKARITKVADQLYQQAVDYKRLMNVLTQVQAFVRDSKMAEAGQLIGKEVGVDISGELMGQALTAGGLKQKLEEADIDTVDRVFDDIKDFVKRASEGGDKSEL